MNTINQFLINCRTCPLGTPCQIATGLDSSLRLHCMGCGRTEILTVNLIIPDPILRDLRNKMLERLQQINLEQNQQIEKAKEATDPEKGKEEAHFIEEPPKPKLTGKAKIMQEILDAKDLKKLEKHKEKLSNYEYMYVKDAIQNAMKKN